MSRGSILTAMSKRAWCALALVLLGCKDFAPNGSLAEELAPRQIVSRIAILNDVPAVGDTVLLQVRVERGAGVGPVGSFTARVDYDSLRLESLGLQPASDGLLRVVNALPGSTRVAGLASTGFTADVLVTLRFVARTADAFSGVRVRFDELHATNREDLARVTPGALLVDRRIPQ